MAEGLDNDIAELIRYGVETPNEIQKVAGGVSPADAGFDLVLLLGQSNMEGGASGGSPDPRLDPVGDRVYSFEFDGTYGRQIVAAQDPLTHQGGNPGIGPGISFGRQYAATIPTNRRVLLVPCAVAGTPLVATPANSWTWNPSVRGNLYDRTLLHVTRALGAAGANSRVVAVLWSQGEADADSGVSTATYAGVLDALIDRLRVDLDRADLPFIVGSMVPEFLAAVPARSQVAAAHVATPTRRAFTAYAQGPGGFVTADGIHFTPAGQRIQGQNMVRALDAARANATAPATILPALVDPTPALTTRRGTPTYGPGKFGRALLGGILGADPFSVTAPVGTMEAWLKDGGAGFRQAITVGWRGWLGRDGSGAAGTVTAEAVSVLGDTNGDGLWHHVALTADGSFTRLWVDGKLARSVPDTGEFLVGGEPLGIGGNFYDAGANWAGGIEEIRISSVIRYGAPFTPPTEPFTLDRHTLALYHLNG